MKTVQELLISIMDDIQEYLNDTDSVDCVPGYSEVRPDIYAHDPEDAADALDDFDLGEIEKTMEMPIDNNSRRPFRPTLRGIYRLAGTRSMYQCISIDDVYHTCTMRNIESPHWTCDVHDIGIYNDYSIDWCYSTGGHFE